MKTQILIAMLVLLVIITGCTTSEKIQDIVKQTEQGKKFLEQYPNAEFKAVKIAESLIAKIINTINKNCGEELEVKSYWKVSFYDPDSDKGIVSYVDTDTDEPICIYSYSKNIKKEPPKEPEKKETTTKTCQELGGYVCSAPDDCGTNWLDSSDSYCCPIKCGTCEQKCINTEKCKIAYCSKETNYQCELKLGGNDLSCKIVVQEEPELFEEPKTDEPEIPKEEIEEKPKSVNIPEFPKDKEPSPKTIVPVVISPSGVSEIIINSDTIWNKENSPYLIKGNIFIKHGATLTMEPGTEIRFEGETNKPYITVEGTLKAIGTDEQKIIFTSSKVLTGESIKEKQSPYYGYWGGIGFMGGRDFGDNKDYVSDSIISHAIIEYAVSEIRIESSHPIIENSIFRKNHFKIELHGTTTSNIPTIIRSNLFEENDGLRGVTLIEINAQIKLTFNIFRNNRAGAINIQTSPRCTECLTIENNLIEKNSARDGAAVMISSKGLNFRFNTIKDNIPVGIIYSAYDPSNINYNNIYSNGDYNLKLVTSQNIDLSNNFWGTTDTKQIDKQIYDSQDYPNVGTVSYTPILTERESKAP